MMKKEIINISIPGDPQTKKRPRFSRYKGQVRTYNSTKDEDNTLRWQMKARMDGQEPLDGTLSVSMIFVFRRPKSRERLKEVFHTITPDIDNLLKKYLDVGNETLWHDDKQVASVSAVKIYGEKPRTVINVSQL